MVERALVVRGGWEGHAPQETTDTVLPWLHRAGFDVQVRDDIDCYTDPELMTGLRLIVQCWTLGRMSADHAAGLSAAVAAGTGLAGWHGGIVDAFRARPEYLQLVGGQFVAHPGGFVPHTVDIVAEQADHEIVAGLPERIDLDTEQYWVLSDDYNDVLATTTLAADDEWSRPVTCPAVWTRRWGAGRVFVCTVGHSPADLAIPAVATIVERGLLWAAAR